MKILVSIRDSKAETWSPIHEAPSKAAAIREFQTLVCDNQQTILSSHPADFDLWQVGELVGDLDSLEVRGLAHLHLANGSDFKKTTDVA